MWYSGNEIQTSELETYVYPATEKPFVCAHSMRLVHGKGTEIVNVDVQWFEDTFCHVPNR